MAESILIVDDEVSILNSLSPILEDEGYQVMVAKSGEEALRIIASEPPDLLLLDIWMPGMDGLETLKRARARMPRLQVMMMSGHGSIETAVKAIKLGAYDYIEKPLSLENVTLRVRHALDQRRLEEENQNLRTRFERRYELVGNSPSMQRLRQLIATAAPTNGRVLISGENGTGKELVARAIHFQSPRRDRPFVAVNCAAIPENLIESELLGHERGAFTGATMQKRGQFEQADGGTLFLDEIGDMSLNTQAKVLRVLQEQQFTRVGGTRLIKVDVRVIAASNKNLAQEIEKGNFRDDLFYRLNVLPIDVPPLRQRRDDIAVLMDYFLRKHSANAPRPMRVSGEARRMLLDYAWPGNVRQLESAIERALLLAEGDEITIEDLPVEIRNTSRVEGAGGFKLPPEGIAFEELERSLLIQAMEQTNWNITRAAKLLGLSFRTMQYRLDKFGIARPGRGKGESEEEED